MYQLLRILLLCLLTGISLSAQDRRKDQIVNYYPTEPGYDKSIFFERFESFVLKSSCEGKLIIRDDHRKIFTYAISPKTAATSFQITADTDSVYAVNRAEFNLSRDSLQMRLKLYFLAQDLSIVHEGVRYELNTIDGACDVVIEGLHLKFRKIKGGEELTLTVSRDILLLDENYYRKKGAGGIWLLQGSKLRFTTLEHPSVPLRKPLDS